MCEGVLVPSLQHTLFLYRYGRLPCLQIWLLDHMANDANFTVQYDLLRLPDSVDDTDRNEWVDYVFGMG